MGGEPVIRDPVLSMNFAPVPSKIPAAHMVAAVESGLRCLPEEVAEPARTKVIGAISKARLPPMNMRPQERHAIKNLQKDDNMMVLPADKRRATVVMDVVEYEQKMNGLLTDSKTYKKLTKDPTPSLEQKMNEMLRQLKKSGSITSSLYDKLRSSARHLPLLYGLPKVHKSEVPLRPTVPALPHLPTVEASCNHLVPPCGNSPSHVRNSKAFTEFIKPQVLPSDKFLISFDVVSRFTDIPVHLAIEVVHCRLKDDVDLCEGGDDALKVLPVSHIPFLSWRCVPPDLRNCNGISSLSYDC